MRRMPTAACVALLISATLALAGCSSTTDTQVDQAETELGTAASPATQGTTITVGPYEMSMTRARLLRNPEPGPDLPAVIPIPNGYLLADVQIRVFNPTDREGRPAQLPMPDPQGFRAEMDSTDTTMVVNVGFSRSSVTRTGPWGPLPTGYRPLEPGETLTFTPQFAVPETAERVTLVFSPLDDPPELAAVFAVK